MPEKNTLMVDFAKDDEIFKLYPQTPLLYSQPIGWNGIKLHYHSHPPHQISQNYSKQHRLIVHDRSPSSLVIEEMIEHRLHNSQLGNTNITFVPNDVLNSACWNKEYRFITLSFEPSVLARHIFDFVNFADLEFIPCFSKSDPLIHSIGLALKSELESSGFGSRLYIDSLIAALMNHLMRHYSNRQQRSQVDSNPLSKRKLQQIIDYIHQHLDRDLALAELAALVQISPSYFSILFKQATGITPHQYVIQCRIERAKELLRQSDLAIADIALRLGFSHQSHLGRHFKRLVGVTPKQFRQLL
ncbi:MAG: AraC family transcriptional regulator [Pleurocapsa sp. MO_226.B13]|nr:AraC family transcriptional regulator [Pleurocapsa sp. MO_226.B13]